MTSDFPVIKILPPCFQKLLQPSSSESQGEQKNIKTGRGVTFGNLGKGSTNYEFSSSNPMWRASLETLDFIPLSTVDYSGGVIITDWYSGEDWWYTYPVVAETYDGFLNDIYGFHVKEKHVLEAIENSSSGQIAEGNIGGGTGMMCLGFKGGTGTSSRVLKIKDSSYTVGAIVQSNFGAKRNLSIAGVPVGIELKDTLNSVFNGPPKSRRQDGDGSIIVIIATDVPLLPHQLKRIAQRIPLGIGIVGGRGSNGSGDIFLAFSTANEGAFNRDDIASITSMPNDLLMPVFEATVQVVEEAIINAMIAAETMEGINGNTSYAIPHDVLVETLQKYNRIKK